MTDNRTKGNTNLTPVIAGADEQRRSALKKLVGVAATTLVPGTLIAPGFVHAAEPAKFKYKIGLSQPAKHPISVGLMEACAEILRESNGKLQIEVYHSGQLGSDTDMLSQVRSGALEFFSTAGMIWGTLVPVAAINVTAFAFPDYQTVWSAMDGDLGAHIRAALGRANLVAQTKIWDHGYRHITTSGKAITTPEDLSGLKIRVPVAPMLTTLFKGLGAAPASMNLAELYTSLQTRVVDAQENPLSIIETAKLYEVQKHCSLSSHAWDGFWLCANKRSWETLPQDLQQLASRIFDAHALKQRAANEALNASLLDSLKVRGMTFSKVDGKPFRQALMKAGFYNDWKGKIGQDAWALLEKYSGKLT